MRGFKRRSSEFTLKDFPGKDALKKKTSKVSA